MVDPDQLTDQELIDLYKFLLEEERDYEKLIGAEAFSTYSPSMQESIRNQLIEIRAMIEKCIKQLVARKLWGNVPSPGVQL